MKFYFPDINVWVAMAYRGHQHHAIAGSWFDHLENDTAGFCRVTQMGFLRLLTNPAVMGDEVKTQVEAWKGYDLLTSDSRVVFYPEPDAVAVEDEFRTLTTTARSTHQQFPDAYLAAFARVGGLTLVTFDRALSKLARKDVLLLR
ncbi:MAG: PIN domain-containing protein [Acidobacteriia bacterium]|nr:PIN domain-containing protein [Terriglobia bacterium]